MNGYLPTVDFTDNDEWRWPWWRFKMEPQELFTTLHERFNTRTCPIQDPKAFLCDVRDCARLSDHADELYAKLAQRKAERVRELEDAWEDIRHLIIWNSDAVWGCQRCNRLANDDDLLEANSHSENDKPRMHLKWFINITDTMSFDCMLRYFDGFLRDIRKREDEKRRLWREKQAKYDQIWAEERRQRAEKREEEERQRRGQKRTSDNGDACEPHGTNTADSTPTSTSPEPVAAETLTSPRPSTPPSLDPDTASECPSQTPVMTPSPHRQVGGQDKAGVTTYTATATASPATETRKRVRSEEKEELEENKEGGGGVRRPPSPPAKRRRVSLPDGDWATADRTSSTAHQTGPQSRFDAMVSSSTDGPQHLDGHANPARAFTETEVWETHQPPSYPPDAQWLQSPSLPESHWPDSPLLPESQLPW